MALRSISSARRLILLSVAVLTLSSSAIADDGEWGHPAHDAFIAKAQTDARGAFKEWVAECGKQYRDEQAEKNAFDLFKQRVATAARINADPETTYYASVNCLADLPLPGQLQPPTAESGEQKESVATASVTIAQTKTVTSGLTGLKKPDDALFNSKYRAAGFINGTFKCPASLNWTALGAVRGVKDQGSNCGTCWAHAAAAAVEAAHFLTYDEQLDLSVAQLVDCTYNSNITISCSKPYLVKSTDFCYKIYTDNGLTDSQFYALNPGIDCNNLQPGQVLCVGSSGGSGTCGQTVPVKSDDTCYSVWTSNNLTAEQFYALNPGVNCDNLQTGQPLCIAATTGCPAGFTDDAYKYIIAEGGIATDATYGPYTGTVSKCKYNETNPVAAATLLSGYTNVPAMDETALLQVVCNQPATVSLTVDQGLLMYKRGVYNAKNCPTGESSINHAVLVVGYGTETKQPQPGSPPVKTDFWIIKNSWGQDWGERGYMRIRRGINACGMVTLPPSYPNVLGSPIPSSVPASIPINPPVVYDPSCPAGKTYTVVQGDSMFDIAAKFNINFQSLLAANPSITNPDVIYPGDIVAIPCPPLRNCTGKVFVKANDTLFDISQRFDVSLEDLLEVNPQFVNPDMIYPGDTVNIPPCDVPPEVQAVLDSKQVCVKGRYTTVAGDTPSRVAKAYNMNVGDLLNLNSVLLRQSMVANMNLRVLRCPKSLGPPWAADAACQTKDYMVQMGKTVPEALDKAPVITKPTDFEYRCTNRLPLEPHDWTFKKATVTCVPYCCAPLCRIKDKKHKAACASGAACPAPTVPASGR